MIRNLALAAGLAALWLLLSGHYDLWFLTLGTASVALTFFIASRMHVVDQEGAPHTLIVRAAIYLPWLMWEVIKSNVDVARRILTPSLPIAPRTFTIRASQTTAVGRVLYANSITLTPGTVTIDVRNRDFEIHALTSESEEELRAGRMDRRVTQVEGAG
jgi:multicomponent Na+:H+ antiporter subunit E